MRERIIEILSEALPMVDFINEDSLVEDGILDSLGITTVISELSLEYGVMIPVEELETENFNSVDMMVAMLKRIL